MPEKEPRFHGEVTEKSHKNMSRIERNIKRDEEKDKQLNFMGWTVIHFWGKDILKNTEQCIKVIEETIFDQKLEEVDDEREI